jgi:hypothetical protein
MKTHRSEATKIIDSTAEERRLDELDELVANAAKGDRFAIGCIAIALSPRLLAEARDALGELFAQDDGDVLQDFFTALCEGALSFPRIRGAGLPWLMKVIREKAWEHLARRGPYGGQAG